MNLLELFPDEDYRLQMRFERGSVAEFFAPTEHHKELISERRNCLQSAPQTYAALLSDGIPLLDETIEMAANWPTNVTPATSPGKTPWQRCLSLGEALEPDFLLLKPQADGQFHLLSGCVCFPSSWSLAEKIGRPLEFIHGVVPGLNPQLGNQIHSFLSKIKPDIAWQRTNWGLSRSPELNQHPKRTLPHLDASVRLEEIWLRVEHQALVALPRNQATLFGIRITTHPLAELKKDAAVASRLSRALQTMPEDMARYKNLATARSTIIALLRS
jgi:dimethylamine monooxygenase subunit A